MTLGMDCFPALRGSIPIHRINTRCGSSESMQPIRVGRMEGGAHCPSQCYKCPGTTLKQDIMERTEGPDNM